RSDHQDDPIRERPSDPEWVDDQRAAAEGVKHLGLPRAHPLSLTRGENDSGHLIHWVWIILPRTPESQSGFPRKIRSRRPILRVEDVTADARCVREPAR